MYMYRKFYRMTLKNVSIGAVLLLSLTSPAMALQNGNESWSVHTEMEDDRETRLSSKRCQFCDGTAWVWRFQAVYNNGVKSCPKTSKTNCKVTFNFSPGDTEVLLRDVFMYRIGARDTNRDFHMKRQVQVFAPVFSRTFSLKPGQYAWPTMIGLDKYIPDGYGTEYSGGEVNGVWDPNGEKRLGFTWWTGPYMEYKRIWDGDQKIGRWSGHIFAKNQQAVCVTNSPTPPTPGGLRNSFCVDKVPEIPKGVSP